jgi:hypothetical protein
LAQRLGLDDEVCSFVWTVVAAGHDGTCQRV